MVQLDYTWMYAIGPTMMGGTGPNMNARFETETEPERLQEASTYGYCV